MSWVIMWIVTPTFPPGSMPSALIKPITRKLLFVNMAIVSQANFSRQCVIVTLAEYNTCKYHTMGSFSLSDFPHEKV